MNDHTIHLVKESFDLVEPIAPQAAELFYANLFALDPSLQPLFKSDRVAQGEKLMQMISLAVGMLDRPQVLQPVLRELGVRHADYGVREEHYDSVGTAFLATMEQGTGVAFTDDVREAWVEVYGEIAGTMKQAARIAA